MTDQKIAELEREVEMVRNSLVQVGLAIQEYTITHGKMLKECLERHEERITALEKTVKELLELILRDK